MLGEEWGVGDVESEHIYSSERFAFPRPSSHRSSKVEVSPALRRYGWKGQAQVPSSGELENQLTG